MHAIQDTVAQIVAIILQIDYSIFHFINQTLAHPILDFVLPICRNKWTWLPVYFFLLFYIFKKHNNRFILVSVIIIVGIILIDFSNHHYLKPYFSRWRPCHNNLIQVRLLLENCGGKWSFPSSHAANHAYLSFIIIFLKIFNKNIYNYLLIIWTIIIGISQVYVGVHYPLDIIAGIFFGLLVSFIAKCIYQFMYKN